MNGTILVFGASGFIGGHLLRSLKEMGGRRLIGVDIVAPEVPVPSVNYIIADVRDLTDFDLPEKIDLLINLAAIHRTPGHPSEAYYETNILGAVEVCKFARRKNINDIIFTSSISVYGPGEDLKTEETPLTPSSAYGWSKMMAEAVHKSWFEENSEHRLIICRPAVVFGANEKGNFTRLTKLLRKGFFVYPGRKDTIKSCIYVKDLIDALFLARKQPDRFVLFNACYAERFTIEHIVETFKRNHFPKVRTFLFPCRLITGLAAVLTPFSRLGLGIHPERVLKLVKSTNVYPGWLVAHKWQKEEPLVKAFHDWERETNGRFY